MGERLRPSIIRVTSAFDPEARMRCCGTLTTQQCIDYDTTFQGRDFRVRRVWASVCGSCQDKYFAPEVSDQIDEGMFRISNPIEAEIVRLMEQI